MPLCRILNTAMGFSKFAFINCLRIFKSFIMLYSKIRLKIHRLRKVLYTNFKFELCTIWFASHLLKKFFRHLIEDQISSTIIYYWFSMIFSCFKISLRKSSPYATILSKVLKKTLHHMIFLYNLILKQGIIYMLKLRVVPTQGNKYWLFPWN